MSNRGKIPISHELFERPVGFLIAVRLTRLGSKEVEVAMIKALSGQPLHSITPDRGREFQLHGNVTKALGVDWDRGTNENTNGLLREQRDHKRNEELQAVVDQLNQRPRKCLGYRTPAEVYFSEMLYLA